MGLLILILCISIELFSTVSGSGQCGQIPNAKMRPNPKRGQENRIVGGVEARPHSHPWLVSIQSKELNHFCGGALIRVGPKDQSDIVLSAAHCVVDKETVPHQISVAAHDLKKPTKTQENIKIAKFVSHPKYDADLTTNDIAIIKLATPIKFSPTIQPICLPNQDESLGDNLEGTVAGWGLTKEGAEEASNVLMQVGLPTVGHKDCAASYKKADPPANIDVDLMLCAGHKKGGQDSCQGDSGGPLIFKTDKGYTVHGVVSFGEGCARPGFPGVFAKVPHYIPWINEQIKELSNAI